MTIRCALNEKVRMLDAFDIIIRDKRRLPIGCITDVHQVGRMENHLQEGDCQVPTSFTSACSGRENCTLHMQRGRLNAPDSSCHGQRIDYTVAHYECISGLLLHIDFDRSHDDSAM
jgi:hypothetical protein